MPKKTCFASFKSDGISAVAMSVILTTFAVIISAVSIITIMTVFSNRGAYSLAQTSTKSISEKTLLEVQGMGNFLKNGAEAVQFSIKLRPTAQLPPEDSSGRWWWIKWQSWTYLFSKTSPFAATDYSVLFVDGSTVNCVSADLIHCQFKRAAAAQELDDNAPLEPRAPFQSGTSTTTTAAQSQQVGYASLISADFGFKGDLVQYVTSEEIYYEEDPRSNPCYITVSDRMNNFIAQRDATTTTSPVTPYGLSKVSSENITAFPDAILAAEYSSVTIQNGTLRVEACFPIVNATNDFIGVGSLAVNVDGLRPLLATVQPTERSNIVILDKWDRVLASSTGKSVTYETISGESSLYTARNYGFQPLTDLLSIIGYSSASAPKATTLNLFPSFDEIASLQTTTTTAAPTSSVYVNNADGIQQYTLDGEKYFVAVSDLSTSLTSLGWRVFVLVPTSDIMHPFRVGTFISIGVSAGLMLVVSIIAALTGKLLFMPLGRIVQNMKTGLYLHIDPSDRADSNPLSQSQSAAIQTQEAEQFSALGVGAAASAALSPAEAERLQKRQRKREKAEAQMKDRSISYLSDVAAIQRAYWTMADELAVLKGYIPEHIRQQLLEGKLNGSTSISSASYGELPNAGKQTETVGNKAAKEGPGAEDGAYSDASEELGAFVVVSPTDVEVLETNKYEKAHRREKSSDQSSNKMAALASGIVKAARGHPSTRKVAFAPTLSSSTLKMKGMDGADSGVGSRATSPTFDALKASTSNNSNGHTVSADKARTTSSPHINFTNPSDSDTEKIKMLIGVASERAVENASAHNSNRSNHSPGHASFTAFSFQNSLVERQIAVAVVNLVGFHQFVANTPAAKVAKDHEAIVAFISEAAKRCGGVLDTFNGDKFWVSFNAATVCNDAPIAATMFACVVDKALNAKSVCTPSVHNNNNNNNSNSLNDFQSTPSRNPSIELLPPGLPTLSAPSATSLKHPNAKSPIVASTPTQFHPQILDIGSDAGSANSLVAPSVNGGIASNAAASLGCTIGVAKGLGYVGALGTSTIKRHTVISNAMSEASALERMATKYPDCKVLIGGELIPFVEGYFQYVMLDASALPGSGGLRNRVAGVKGLMLQPGFMFPFALRTEVCKLSGSSSSHTSNEAILSAIASLPHFNPFADINHCFMLYLEGRAEEAMMRLQVIGAQVAASSIPTHGPVGLDGRPIAGEGSTSTPYPQHPYQQQQYLGRQRAGGVKPLSPDEASSISLVMECLDMLIRSMDGRVYQSPLGVLF